MLEATTRSTALGHELVGGQAALLPATFVASYASLIAADVAGTMRLAPVLVGSRPAATTSNSPPGYWRRWVKRSRAAKAVRA